MLLVGSILPAGAGAQLWQLAGAAPANIELNTTAGADGIAATMPADSSFGIALTDTLSVLPIPVAACYNFDTATQILKAVGVASTPGGLYPFMLVNDFLNGLTASIQIDNPQTLRMYCFEGATSNEAGVYVINFNNVKAELRNSGGLAGGRLVIDLNAATVAYFDTVTNLLVNEFIVDSQFNFRDGAGTNLFRIGAAGQVQTNQTAASVAVRAKVAEMPIFDTAGVLVGYIDINL